MALPSFLQPVVESWAAFYGSHQLVSVAVRFVHLSGIVLGGGTALVADRRTLRALRSGAGPREAALAELAAAHRVVVPALAFVVATGVLMAASDTDTFLNSRLYWSKMGLVTLLLLNGLGLRAAERAASAGSRRGWAALGLASAASLLLWLSVLFAGVWLTVAA
jgi:hypothetical protein